MIFRLDQIQCVYLLLIDLRLKLRKFHGVYSTFSIQDPSISPVEVCSQLFTRTDTREDMSRRLATS